MQSIIQQRSAVSFPAFTGERVYMREFTKADGLPEDLRRWQPTVDAMLDGIDVAGPVYIMIDQKLVRAGQPQRRPGVHIDGYWNPAIQAHGGPEPGHSHFPRNDGWPVEAILLASNVQASRAFEGEYDCRIAAGGDCSHLDVSALRAVPLTANVCHAGNVTMLHESLPVEQDALRTLVRLNVPGWEPRSC